ncbi:MAG TPA: IS1595 family transposase [Phycisphaerales bacterium]|nr:IS1595 family transposase [Phycisphaerales bacterium]HMP38352.1 IS1595 family transposase [Phycisphaerales bacterium]
MARKPQCKVGGNKSQVVADIPVACSDEAAAVEFMERQRWGDKPTCPACTCADVYRMKSRSGGRNADKRWRCRGCGKLFTVRTGTVMEESRIPLRHWCYAFWRACTSKKGVAALEIQRQTGLSYKSALFLMHRIRWAMAPVDGPKLDGIVEADETYVGGKPRHRLPQAAVLRGDRPSNYVTRYQRLASVFGAVERQGQTRLRVIPEVTSRNLREALREHVARSARLMTDERQAYIHIGREYASHDAVCHSSKVYVRDGVTTNSIESVFALLKRGINGIWHNVSKVHLQRYLDEVQFRYNHRDMEDGDRTVAAIRAGCGKRLRYREAVAG